MRKLILLPLEPLEQRYTEQWYRYYPAVLKENEIDYLQVDGEKLTSKIETGSILDVYGTSFWKFTQLAKLVEHMRSGEVTSDDVIFFTDLWYPGLEALKYISCQGGQKPKIAGILHAGSWDPADFVVRTGMKPWAHPLESVWMQMYDWVFVATQFHKDLILKSHNIDPDKIKVTGLPFYPDEFATQRKSVQKDDRLIVFPHRLDKEKNPDIFDSVVSGLNCSVIKTSETAKSKTDFYDTLSRATIAVSTADQETFGYSMLEAEALGCIPLVPNKLSYAEMYPELFKYNSQTELRVMLESILSLSQDGLNFYKKEVQKSARHHRAVYSNSISRMFSHLT